MAHDNKTEETDYAEALRQSVEDVISRACEQPGGLHMHVCNRTGKKTSEHLVFGPGSLKKVVLGADCTLVLVMNGSRHWLQSKEENCSVIRDIRNHAGGMDIFEFPRGISFHATAKHGEEIALTTEV